MQRARSLVDAYLEHDLLTYASAIAFQIVTAIVPFVLFSLALLGFLNLEDVWRDDLAPDVREQVSFAAFTLITDVVDTALTEQQVFWLTAGFLLALWQVSGAVRAVMGALNAIYRTKSHRSWGRRMALSLALGLAVGLCFLLAMAVLLLGPALAGDVGGAASAVLHVGRWALAAALLLLAVGLLVKFAPEREQPLAWVSFGSALVMVGWLVMSALFGVYLRSIASYGSIFSYLATFVVLFAYLYASAIVFLGGLQIDALLRDGEDAIEEPVPDPEPAAVRAATSGIPTGG